VNEFFKGLEDAEHAALLRGVSGTVRFDLTDAHGTEHWIVAIEDGEIDVSRGEGSTDAALAASKDTFAELIARRANPMAALLRGDVTASGDPRLLVRAQRLFPRPST
jgi:putative sterol carrier protein